ncbi:MAG: hypothetical protein GXY86_05395 [Firmicutes bacterium]|nr:hypothetical protein [Bacillota bacterium]
MGLGIYINGEINVGRLFKGRPPEEKVLKDIEKFFRNHGNDILKKLVWVDRAIISPCPHWDFGVGNGLNQY